MANILGVFLDSEQAHITISDFPMLGIDIEDANGSVNEKFLFHLQLAVENNLISNRELDSSSLKSVGLNIGTNGHSILTGMPIRLTQNGHDFASALAHKEIFERLKVDFKDASFKIVFDCSQKLLMHVFKKKIDSILE